MFLYSEAIINKLRELTENQNIFISDLGENIIRNSILSSTEHKEEAQLPLIGVSRTGWRLAAAKNYPMYKTGISKEFFTGKDEKHETIANDVKQTICQVIPIEIDYQLDVITGTIKQNDMIIRELFFYFLQNPTLLVKVPYQLDFDHVVSFILGNEVEDNSDIESHQNNGVYMRQTISFTTEGAYLWKSDYGLVVEQIESGLHLDGYKEVTDVVIQSD